MMFTAPMRLLAAAALKTDADAIAASLLELGALDLVSVRELSGEWSSRLEALPPRVSATRLEDLRKRVDGLFAIAEPPLRAPELQPGSAELPDLDAAEKTLDGIAAEATQIRERQKSFHDEMQKLEELRRQVELFDDFGDGARKSSYAFLSIRTGTLAEARLGELERSLETLPSVLLPSSQASGSTRGVLLVCLKRDERRVDALLAQLGWENAAPGPASGGGKDEALAELGLKIERLKTRRDACRNELSDLIQAKKPRLDTLWAGLRMGELVSRLRLSFSGTGATVLFSGWIPAERQAEVEKAIGDASSGRCHIEWMAPGQGEAEGLSVPVEMRNPTILKPFEALVRNYAIPEYGSVDPTPFTAVAYLCMFGLMFGDLGQGLVLAAIGLIGRFVAKKKGASTELFRLIAWCGAASMVTGLLFGSFFGQPLLKPLWFDYHGIVAGEGAPPSGSVRDVYDILGITIVFGMMVLATGFLINWVNLVRKRRWVELLLDKGGLLGGWIYAAGAWVAFGFVASDYRELPPAPLLAILLGAPTLILALKGPVEFARHGRKAGKRVDGFTVIDFFMEWIVEVLEIYSGYLANTLSFMRVAGLGIAHVSLMLAFARIAQMLAPSGGFSIPAILILALGNVMVIGLEGLSAGIQSLRLNYYEFFSKYFNGTGKAYRPISLRAGD